MELPDDHMRLLWIDPGWQALAITFWAIPPDASCIHLYDEFFSEKGSADVAADIIAKRSGKWKWELFGIDKKASEQHTMSTGKTHLQHYQDAFALKHLKSRVTGGAFALGSPNTEGRTESLKRWLKPQPATEKPLLQVHRNCQRFIWEMQRQYFKQDRPDKREDMDNHLVHTAEYCAAYFDHWVGRSASGLYYHPPEKNPHLEDPDQEVTNWWLKLLEGSGEGKRGIPLGPRTTTFRRGRGNLK